MTEERIALEFGEDRVARITLTRSERLNAFDIAMRDQFWEALLAVRDNPDAATVVVRAAGPHFSAGADLSEFGSATSPSAARRVRFERPLWELLWTFPKPVVAALRGYVFGSGLEIALMCDARLAAGDAVLALPEAQFGMIPAAGGSQTLTRVGGVSRALGTILSCEQIDAHAALAAGLVDELVADPGAAAAELAARWARLGAARCALAKSALRGQGRDGAGATVERTLARLYAEVGS
jgi:enoyl-CoA hydratase/carnithine racemase